MFLLKKGRAIYNLFINYKTFYTEIFELLSKKLTFTARLLRKMLINRCMTITVSCTKAEVNHIILYVL